MTHRPRLGRAIIPFLMLALLLSVCEPSAPPDGRSDAAPVLTVEVEEVYRVGRVDGDSWDTFSRVASVAFDAEGRLHILDSGRGRVHIVDAEGTRLRSFGRSGQGPGEFRGPSALTLLVDGRIAIADSGHQAFLLFTPDGEFLASRTMGESGELPGSSVHRQGAASVVSVTRGFRMVTPPGGGRAAPPAERPIRRWNLDRPVEGPGTGTVLVDPWRPAPATSTGSPSLGPMLTSLPHLAPEVHLAVLPDGRLAVADSSAYEIRIYPPDGTVDGDPPRVIGREDVLPVRVDARMEADEREYQRAELAAGGGPQIQLSTRDPGGEARIAPDAQVREMLEAQVAELDFWHEIPVITHLAADPQGRLWVERSAGVREEGPIDLLGPDGTLFGTIPAGGPRTPSAFGPAGLAAWIERDEFDVPSVRVGRLRPWRSIGHSPSPGPWSGVRRASSRAPGSGPQRLTSPVPHPRLQQPPGPARAGSFSGPATPGAPPCPPSPRFSCWSRSPLRPGTPGPRSGRWPRSTSPESTSSGARPTGSRTGSD